MGFFNFMLLSLLLVVNTLIAIKNKEHIEEIKRMIELLESEE